MSASRFIPAGAIAAGVLLGFSSLSSGAVIADFNAGIGPSANNPYPTSAFDTWYDITSDAFATPVAGTLDGSPALRINDGGFTNGVYIIYDVVVPSTGEWQLKANMFVVEDAAAPNGIRNYEMGAVVNGTHRVDHPTDPDDLATINPAAPGSGIANYSGLTTGFDTGPTQTLLTDSFTANAGDHLLVAFSTDLDTGNFDGDSGTWSANTYVLVDNLELVLVPEPAALGLMGLGGLILLGRRRGA